MKKRKIPKLFSTDLILEDTPVGDIRICTYRMSGVDKIRVDAWDYNTDEYVSCGEDLDGLDVWRFVFNSIIEINRNMTAHSIGTAS